MLRLPFNSSISVGGLTGGEDTGLHMLCWFGVGVVGAGWRWILDFVVSKSSTQRPQVRKSSTKNNYGNVFHNVVAYR